MQANHMKILDHDVGSGWVQYCNNRKLRVPSVFCRYVSATSRGSDPISV